MSEEDKKIIGNHKHLYDEIILNEEINLPQELEESLKEAVEIEKEFKEGKRKGYNNAIEMLKSIFDD